MKNIFIFFFTIFLLLLSNSIYAQEAPINRAITIVPQHILNNSIRIEWDKKLDNSNNWLIIAPELIIKYDGAAEMLSHTDYNSVLGGGLNILMRNYIFTDISGKGIYYSYGAGYKHYNIETEDYLWGKSSTNNLNYYTRKKEIYDLSIHSFSIQCTAGYQMSLFDNLIGDAYIGAGMKFPIHKRPEGSFIKFNDSFNDYGYMGTYLVLGIRIGVGW